MSTSQPASSVAPIASPLGSPFILWQGVTAAIEGTDLRVRLLSVKREYAGHRFEELGDQYRAELLITAGGKEGCVSLEWWERDELPDTMLHHEGYSFEVHGSATPHSPKKCWLELAVKRTPSPAQAEQVVEG